SYGQRRNIMHCHTNSTLIRPLPTRYNLPLGSQKIWKTPDWRRETVVTGGAPGRFSPQRVPVDRVVLMLQQAGTRLPGQVIRVLMGGHGRLPRASKIAPPLVYPVLRACGQRSVVSDQRSAVSRRKAES